MPWEDPFHNKVVLTIPGAAIADSVMGCGTTAGRDTDKIAQFHMEMLPPKGTDIQVPAHRRVAIVCKMKEYREVGDHYLYLWDVEWVYGNEAEEALFAWNGYAQLRLAK